MSLHVTSTVELDTLLERTPPLVPTSLELLHTYQSISLILELTKEFLPKHYLSYPQRKESSYLKKFVQNTFTSTASLEIIMREFECALLDIQICILKYANGKTVSDDVLELIVKAMQKKVKVQEGFFVEFRVSLMDIFPNEFIYIYQNYEKDYTSLNV